MSNILELHGVNKRYASVQAVDSVSLNVRTSSIFGLLGPNGAGKTSLIRMIAGVTLPDSGEILFESQQINSATQQSIGYLPEERGLYKKMNVGEQIMYFAMLKGLSSTDAKKKTDEWLARFELTDWTKKKTRELSKGMQQKVQYIITVIHEPRLIILDEPFSGLDPINAELIVDSILEMRKHGVTIIFSTHRMEQVEAMCDDIALIDHGKKVLGGDLRELRMAAGKRSIEFSFDDEGAWLESLKEITIIDRHPRQAVCRMTNGTSPQEILNSALASGARLTRYALVEPSVKELFLEATGQL